MEIGQLGAFCFLDAMPAEESAAFCRRVERLGYQVLWTPEAWGRDPFAHGGYLLAKTEGCSDRLVDTLIAWGSEEQIRERIDAHLAAGANHVCLMPLRSDHEGLPDERALAAFAPRGNNSAAAR